MRSPCEMLSMEEMLIECELWVPLSPLRPEQPLACCSPTPTPAAIKMPGPGPVPAQLYPQFAPLGNCSHPGLVPSPLPLGHVCGLVPSAASSLAHR